ncbi:MAG: hypothetical protein A2293_01105 [Elusimicrobia bacterium RIFOXYB2_FULL_49_7]|nr:MAG: hypothetical protein A2293_01105 [Elusimicrobia bacterium RIFOXYB2_FULL_49_7]
MNSVLRYLSDLRLTLAIFVMVGVISLAGIIKPQIFFTLSFNFLLGLLVLNLLCCLFTKIFRTLKTVRVGKGVFYKTGSLLLHVGVVVLMGGAGMTRLRSTTEHVELFAGEHALIKGTGWIVRVDDFRVVRNEAGDVKDYITQAVLLENGRVLKRHAIEVNSPLVYQDYHVYQNQYGALAERIRDARLHVRRRGGERSAWDTSVVVPYGGQVTLAGGLHLFITDYFCDFMIDFSNKQPANRSHEPGNPALKYHLLAQNGDTLQSGWLFFNHPTFHDSQGEYHIQAEAYTPLLYTGLEIRKNPGVPVVIAGFVLLSLGLLLVFYFPARRVPVEPTIDVKG